MFCKPHNSDKRTRGSQCTWCLALRLVPYAWRRANPPTHIAQQRKEMAITKQMHDATHEARNSPRILFNRKKKGYEWQQPETKRTTKQMTREASHASCSTEIKEHMATNEECAAKKTALESSRASCSTETKQLQPQPSPANPGFVCQSYVGLQNIYNRVNMGYNPGQGKQVRNNELK